MAAVRRRRSGTGWLAIAARASERENTEPPAQMPSGAASDRNNASVSISWAGRSCPVTTAASASVVEAVLRGAFAPCGDEVIGGGVVLGRAGSQHDVFDSLGWAPRPISGSELLEGVVDLVASLRELADHSVVDAGDLPAGLAARPPPHAELSVSWWRISAVASADAAWALA
jgi:hypothetical protein